jgi:hypothetical protein
VEVDEEVRELRQRFETASTAQDYRDIGNRCVTVTEMLGDAVYDPTRYQRRGEHRLGRGETKKRFDRYIEVALQGREHAAARSLARAVSSSPRR